MYERPEIRQCENVTKVEKEGLTLKIYFADGSILYARYREVNKGALIVK